MRRLVDEATERIVAHVSSLPTQESGSSEGAIEYARTLQEPMPETGEPWTDLLSTLFEDYVPRSYNTAGPGYLAYIPGGGLFHSAVAELIASSVNRYVGVAVAAPALVQLEMNVIRWFCDAVGLPPGAGGVLTTGGSMANFIATVAARRERLPEMFLDGVIYASNQVHHSVEKAASLAGFPAANIRVIPTDEMFRMRTADLVAAVRQDREKGRKPFMVVASAGTTNTGAVDDLETIAEIADEEALWFHVDGAYGGFFALTERGKTALKGLGRADSITLDPHKALFLPYGTGCLLVRHPETLRKAHSAHADYMPPMQDAGGLVDFCEISPELSRDFRGLRLWLPIKLLGIAPFRNNLDEKLDLAEFATARLRAIDGIEIVAEPQLSIVAFRYEDGRGVEELNEVNRKLIEKVNARKRVWLTGTMLGERFVIRFCILSFRTHLDRIEAAIEDLELAVTQVRRAASASGVTSGA
jgi:aromatic-L-amino-acid decarboxylase